MATTDLSPLTHQDDSIPYPWQIAPWQQLQRMLTTQRLSHALLFSGAKGLGKKALADYFVQSLLCSQASAIHRPCGKCRDCEWYGELMHPDVLQIKPEEDAGIIKIATVRQVIEFSHTTPQRHSGKIVVIDMAEMMHVAAANAILKTLEEPPAKLLLLLITSELALLPLTIRSRCQLIHFPSYTHLAEKLAWLSRMTQQNSEQASLALSLHGYAPLRAKTYLLENKIANRATIMAALQALLRKEQDPLIVAQSFMNFDLVDCINWMLIGLLDMIRLKLGLQPSQLSNQDLVTELTLLAPIMDLCACQALAARLMLSRVEVVSNLNQQLIIEDICCRWSQLTLNKGGIIGDR